MTAVFFKRFSKIARLLLACFFVTVGIYASVLGRVTSAPVFRSFYFLVSKTEHVQAGVYQSVLDGGAGFVLEENGEYFVALSAYRSKDQAEKVREGLTEDTEIIEYGVEKLYFKSYKEKRIQGEIISAFSCLEDCIEVLDGEITRLDKGATQSSSKNILAMLLRQFSFLGEKYGGTIPAFEELCNRAIEQIEEALQGIVYAAKLRYLLCDACFSFVKMGEYFSL